MRTLFLLAAIAGLLQTPQPAPAPPPGTDIYLVPLKGGLASMKGAKPSPISAAPGYDNQPNFSPDGRTILFAANRDGKQSDVYAFDRASGKVTQLTRTAENENSPTFIPPGVGAAGFSVVQSEFDRSGNKPASPIQRLWRFNARQARLVLWTSSRRVSRMDRQRSPGAYSCSGSQAGDATDRECSRQGRIGRGGTIRCIAGEPSWRLVQREAGSTGSTARRELEEDLRQDG